ncbi:hypothetical protein N9T46_00600 [bacterium]|nr:hypothetical protein [bacterium]
MRWLLSILFVMLSSSAFAEEITMKCTLQNLMENETTNFKFVNSFFTQKTMQRRDGNWIDLSSNPRLLEYETGNLSASFLVKKRDNWWVRAILDFETKEINYKSCYTRECEEGRLVAKGSKPCE